MSPKLDGIRAVHKDGLLLSRKFKPIPNRHTRALFEIPDLRFVDGELIAGPPNAADAYNRTLSAVSSRAGWPDVSFWLFDHFMPEMQQVAFYKRLRHVQLLVENLKARGVPVKFVKHFKADSPEDILRFEEKCLDAGFEGVMLRDPQGPYRAGRSTISEGYLFKLKRFEDGEATIVGYKEKMHNDNPAEINELGRTKRSSHKANKRPAGTFGGFTLQLPDGKTFNAPMGKGWNDAAKAKLWEIRDQLIGKTVVFESFPIGKKDLPRQPKVKTIKGFRDMEFDS